LLFYLIGGGFDHDAGHPLLFLDDTKTPNCRKNNGFKDLGNYSEWPKVAGTVIKARGVAQKLPLSWGIIWKSACLLANITLRKSQSTTAFRKRPFHVSTFWIRY
jgi:hypothetical protein